METTLFIPIAPKVARGSWRLSRTWKWVLLAAVLGLILVGLIWRFGFQMLDVPWHASGPVEIMVALAIVAAIVFLVVLWILFPVFVFFSLRRIEVFLDRIEQNTRR